MLGYFEMGAEQRRQNGVGESKNHRWISSEASRRDVHKIRQRVQAILVGIETVLADDPLLTVRPEKEKQPLRIVLDTDLRIPLDCKLLKDRQESHLC